MSKRFGRPSPEGYRYKPSIKHQDSYKTIIHLHKIERQLRQEIAQEQVTHWSQEKIKARWG